MVGIRRFFSRTKAQPPTVDGWRNIIDTTIKASTRRVPAYLRAEYQEDLAGLSKDMAERASRMSQIRAMEFAVRVVRRKLRQYGAYDEAWPYEGVA